jgi:hypothetical protein
MVANAMKKLRLVWVSPMRYRLSQTAVRIVMVYFPQLTRCGNTFPVSR